VEEGEAAQEQGTLRLEHIIGHLHKAAAAESDHEIDAPEHLGHEDSHTGNRGQERAFQPDRGQGEE
jgi:hypothetical protein